MSLRILLLLFCIVVSETGFVQDNQNIFYGPSEGFESAPISYQYFVNYDKSSSSDHNSVDVQSSNSVARSESLFQAADYADQAAYKDEVENAHRVALVKRHNDTDAAYVEAYTEALIAQRKFGLVAPKNSYISHPLPNHFRFKPEHLHSLVSARSNSNFQSGYEDEDNEKYFLTDGNHGLSKSVEYVAVPDYEFNDNGVVHRQPENVAEISKSQFAAAKHGSSSPAINYYA